MNAPTCRIGEYGTCCDGMDEQADLSTMEGKGRRVRPYAGLRARTVADYKVGVAPPATLGNATVLLDTEEDGYGCEWQAGDHGCREGS